MLHDQKYDKKTNIEVIETTKTKNGTSKVGKQQYICNNKQCSKSSFILDYT